MTIDWLQQAYVREQNFFDYCAYMDRRWGKPHGSEYKWRQEAIRDREQVAAYYASDLYKRIRGERMPAGLTDRVQVSNNVINKGTENKPENGKKIHHPDYKAKKRSRKDARRAKNRVARKQRKKNRR